RSSRVSTSKPRIICPQPVRRLRVSGSRPSRAPMTAAAAASTTPVASAQPFLKLSGLRKTYPGVVALADFSLDVAPGEIIGLVGENGAGKSTLMKILGGVTPPDRGTIEIDGSPHD